MTKKNLLIFLVPATLCFILSIAIFSPSKTMPTNTPLPEPNGYPDLVAAGGLIQGDAPDASDVEAARTHIASNREALERLRLALERECRIPPLYEPAIWDKHMDEMAALKRLALLLSAEGRVAEAEDRVADAATSYHDVMQLGQAAAQGGVVIDKLVGIALEKLGTTALSGLIPRLEAGQCRELAASLVLLDAQADSLEQILRQEKEFTRAQSGLMMRIGSLVNYGAQAKFIANFTQRTHEQQARNRRLILDLAARAHELEHGRPVASTADLVPGYLRSLPNDPFTGIPMSLDR